ncbi:MAG TPA: ferritin-like domain-containing protein [Candidatus Didemnitutus sp.]|nr:ferritin-like domain-containing protein [Candidatus Didemnitutus sp.]
MRTSREWAEYFQQNERTLLGIPWELGGDLTPAEIAAISASVQEFQAGESSEGRHLIRYAREYAARSGDVFYLDAIRGLIAEEHRHARDLGRIMQLNGIPAVKTTFADRVFRFLRNFMGGLEISVTVLVMAEIIAKVYYAALREATRSIVLRRLCDQILCDEVRHVEFQTDQLVRLRSDRGAFGRGLTMILQVVLFSVTIGVVWLGHRRALARGGYPARRWAADCWQEFRDAFAATPVPVEAPVAAGR